MRHEGPAAGSCSRWPLLRARTRTRLRRGPGGTAKAHGQAGQHRLPPAKVKLTRVRLADGALVTLAKFTGGVRYVLHSGSEDPGRLARGLVHAGRAVSPAGRQRLVAAFNGGFKLSAGVGGYEQEGHVVSPLRPGMASLVLYRSGAVGIGAWGQSVPIPSQPVYSVRQNQYLLVSGGQPTPAAANWRAWGATLGGGELVARSAVGVNAAGQLIYAGSMSASQADLAAALVRAGATVGMRLDISPEWVQLAYAHRPGGRLHKGIPGQVRPADRYLRGWTRDFIAVLAISAPQQP